MNHTGRRTAAGVAKLLGVQGLGALSGLLVAAYLGRAFGPERYGLFAVAAATVLAVELTLVQFFNRAAVRLVAGAADDGPVVSLLVQAQLAAGVIAAAALAVAAPVLAARLGAPELTLYLRLFALDVPLFTLAQVQRSILIGRSGFGAAAVATTVHPVARLVLVVALVAGGAAVPGAILAGVGASALQALGLQFLVRPRWWRRPGVPARGVLPVILPLAAAGIALGLLYHVDVLFVKALDPRPAAAGYYGAARNITVLPFMFVTAALGAPLLASLTVLHRGPRPGAAAALTVRAARWVLCLLPFAALVAGSAGSLVRWVYGPSFGPAAQAAAVLVCGGPAHVLLCVGTASLAAVHRPVRAAGVLVATLGMAVGAHRLMVPAFGAVGAAAVTSGAFWAGALAMDRVVRRHCGARVGGAAVARVLGVSVPAAAASVAWKTTGAWVLAEMTVLAVGVAVALVMLGELSREEVRVAWSMVCRSSEGGAR